MATKPTPGGSDGAWGTGLNEFLEVSLASDGKVKDGAVFSTSTEPTVDAGVANKKYVDDIIATHAAVRTHAAAWAYVATNGTINDSFNVSSVVRNSAGNYTVNWDTDFASANYAVVGTPTSVGYNLTVDSQATGSIVVKTALGISPTDNRFNIIAFGTQ